MLLWESIHNGAVSAEWSQEFTHSEISSQKNNETMMLYEHKNIQYTNFYKQHEACAP